MPVYGVSLASFQHLSSNGSGRERLMRVYSTLWAWAEIGAFPDNHVNGRRRVHRFFTATFLVTDDASKQATSGPQNWAGSIFRLSRFPCGNLYKVIV
jgi:hypothetical protein